jgi:hypothetical protein
MVENTDDNTWENNGDGDDIMYDGELVHLTAE